MISKIARRRGVAFVVPNFRTTLPRHVKVTQADLKLDQQLETEQRQTWNIDYLEIPKLWEQKLKGEGVLIGHLDTGVDASHPDLEGKIEEFALFDPTARRVECEPFDSSLDGHGTHTAGIMVGGNCSGVNIGVAPEAKIVSALVLMDGATNAYNVIKGIEWIVDHGVRVLNLSLGGAGYNATYEFLMQKVIELEILPSCSVGNDGLAVTESPGNLALALGVGAIDRKRRVPTFSGGGSVSWYDRDGRLVPVHNPDLVAPGVAIRSSLPQRQWDHRKGTSMAAPHVSGVVALLAQAEPKASLTQLVDAIKSTTDHPQTSSRPPMPDSRYGLGIINPMRALEKLRATLAGSV
jgi:subtilisin family serine protease